MSRVLPLIVLGGLVILIGEAIDRMSSLRRRTARRLEDWSAGIRRDEHRAFRDAEVVALARWMNRSHR